MGFLRGGFKSAVGGGKAKQARSPWVSWAVWIVLGLGAAFLASRSIS